MAILPEVPRPEARSLRLEVPIRKVYDLHLLNEWESEFDEIGMNRVDLDIVVSVLDAFKL